jgi:ADP-glucose pyrophosphorylase
MDKLVCKLIDSDDAVAVYPFEGYWQDIGNVEEYKRAIVVLPLLGLDYMQNH